MLALDYHPRTRRLRPPVAIGAGLATAVCTIVAVLSLAGGASSAFAGWTRQPTAPRPGQLAAAQAYCAKQEPTPGLPVKLTDTRGPFTFEVYANDSSNDFCITGPSFINARWLHHLSADDGPRRKPVSLGRAHHDPRRAVLRIRDRPRRRRCERGNADPGGRHRGNATTVQNGWAVAWWPGNHQVTTAELTTPTSTQTQTFPLSSCGLHNCSGSQHGGVLGGGPGGS